MMARFRVEHPAVRQCGRPLLNHAAPESPQIMKARVGADGDIVQLGPAYGFAHH